MANQTFKNRNSVLFQLMLFFTKMCMHIGRNSKFLTQQVGLQSWLNNNITTIQTRRLSTALPRAVRRAWSFYTCNRLRIKRVTLTTQNHGRFKVLVELSLFPFALKVVVHVGEGIDRDITMWFFDKKILVLIFISRKHGQRQGPVTALSLH